MTWALLNTQKIREYPSSFNQSHSKIQLDEMESKTSGMAINTNSLISRDDIGNDIRLKLEHTKYE
ncbi:MAG: hypothetical protein EA359_04870 [Balneolaceae bacterium]|nr:MAG: hypothetical protein EA359_04870 [Balneolaceae bacterium]